MSTNHGPRYTWASPRVEFPLLVGFPVTPDLGPTLAIFHSSGLVSDPVRAAMELHTGAKFIAMHHLPSRISSYPPPPELTDDNLPTYRLAFRPSGSQLLCWLACRLYLCSVDTLLYSQTGLSMSVIVQQKKPIPTAGPYLFFVTKLKEHSQTCPKD